MSDQEPALEEATIEELQHSMTEGLRTAYSLTEEYLERIERIDRSGPTVNSVLALNPDVLDTAAKLDEEREEKGPRGPLHGIPILLKDNLGTGDRMRRQGFPGAGWIAGSARCLRR